MFPLIKKKMENEAINYDILQNTLPQLNLLLNLNLIKISTNFWEYLAGIRFNKSLKNSLLILEG